MWRPRFVGLVLGRRLPATVDVRRPPSLRLSTYLTGGLHGLPPGSENDLRFMDLARFAVAEHNKTPNYLPLEFVRVVKVSQQVVAGFMHYLVIEVNEGGRKELYQAKVWEKSWENFKELQGFKRYNNRFFFE